jgi:hypothetical protein
MDPPGLGFPPGEPETPPAAEPEEPIEPPSPGPWSEGPQSPPAGRSRRTRAIAASGGPPAGDDRPVDEPEPQRSRRLLPLLGVLLLLVGAAFLVKTQLLDDNSDSTTAATPVPRTSTVASAPSGQRPRVDPAKLAAALKDPHFRHGYEAATTPAEICQNLAVKERAAGYAWNAHDRAGCMIALGG